MTINNLNHTLDLWINAVNQYSFAELCAVPAQGSWSMGQMIQHLINDTQFYLSQIEGCISTNDNASEKATPHGRMMLDKNEFPDERIEGAASNANIPQPTRKENLVNDLLKLKEEVNLATEAIAKSKFHGKTKHPGLGYFSAEEWLQFVDMHFRHHLRQKERIDKFLQRTGGQPNVGGNSVYIEVMIPSSLENVWAAWTDPTVVIRWFGSDPDGKGVNAVLDVRENGKFEVTFQNADKTEHTCYGTYTTVQKPAKLSFTWQWRSEPGVESLVTVSFSAENDHTKMCFTHSRLGAASQHNYEQGWRSTFEKLKRLLAN